MIATESVLSGKAQQGGISISIGIISAVLSSACQSIGLILQRKSHLIYEQESRHYKPPYKRSLWRIGFLLFLISNIFGSSVQITTLPLIILSPLQSIGLVFNSLFSSLILNEVFTQNSLIGTVLTCVGALLIATFGRIPEPDYNLDQFLVFLKRSQFITWVLINSVIIVGLLSWIVLSVNSVRFAKPEDDVAHQGGEPSDEEESLIIDNDNYINSTTSNEYEHFEAREFHEQSKWSKLAKEYWKHTTKCMERLNHQFQVRLSKTAIFSNSSLVQGVFLGWISGTLSGFSLLLAKSTIEILINCITSKSNLHKILSQPLIWMIVLSFFVLCLAQLWFLNQGLKLISTSILYPLVFCIYNIVNIGNELIFFNQWAIVNAWQLFNIFIGTTLVFAGVAFLSWRFDEFGDTEQREEPTRLRTNSHRAAHNHHQHNHFHNHQRNFSLESNFNTNKRVGLSSILHAKSPVSTHNAEQETIQENERSALISTPVFKNYFTLGGNGNNSVLSGSQKTPTRKANMSLAITIPSDDEIDEGHSEYISFGSPNNKFSPTTSTPHSDQDFLVSPLSAKPKKQSLAPTPTKLAYEMNGFRTRDMVDQSSLSSNRSIDAESNSNNTTPKKRYTSLGNILHGNSSNTTPRKNGKRFLSYEQNELLNQLRNI